MLKADLHIHTEYSMDCKTTLREIVDRCLKTGINCIAVADHGNIQGAVKLQSLAPFPVIVAEEILTPHGEIMGMFLKEGIPSGLSLEQAVSEIKAQGALVCVPHPFDVFRGSALGAKVVESIAEQIDVLEVFNARNPLLKSSREAQAFARKYGIPGSAGSDAHTLHEIGKTYAIMPEFNGKTEFLKALAGAKIYGQRTNPLVHVSSLMARLKSNRKEG